MKKLLKSKIFWLVIVILVVAGVVGYKLLVPNKTIEYLTEKAKTGNVLQTVSATGKIKSASEIQLNFKNAGKISSITVKVNDKIVKDQVLAQLKATDLQIGITQVKANLDEAVATLNKLRAGATSQEIAIAQKNLETAQTDLANAKRDLESTRSTYSQNLDNQRKQTLVSVENILTKANISLQKVYDSMNFEGNEDNFKVSDPFLKQQVWSSYDASISLVDQARLALNVAKLESSNDYKIDDSLAKSGSALDRVSLTLSDLNRLFDSVIVTSVLTLSDLDTLKSTINNERTITDTSIGTLQTVKNSLADSRLSYQTKLQSSENQIATAEKNLSRAQADLDLKKAPARSEDVALYQARVLRAQADYQLAQDRLGDSIIKAPIDGVVTEINYEVGEQNSLSEPVIVMLANEKYEIEVDIPESDIVKLDVGDVTDITFDAFTDEDIFKGNITSINPAETEIQDVIYYRVTVNISDQQPDNVLLLKDKIKPGMTANVTIKTAEVNNVLIIPLRAVKETDDNKYVEVLVNEEVVKKEVVIGLKGDDGYVEVKSGLNIGDEVITYIK